jgi:hypothetical protein
MGRAGVNENGIVLKTPVVGTVHFEEYHRKLYSLRCIIERKKLKAESFPSFAVTVLKVEVQLWQF